MTARRLLLVTAACVAACAGQTPEDPALARLTACQQAMIDLSAVNDSSWGRYDVAPGCGMLFNKLLMPTADKNSFEVMAERRYLDRVFHTYARDEQRVYYEGRELADVEPEAFQATGNYGWGTSRVFYSGSHIAEADAATFVVLNRGFGKDKDSVYYGGQRLENADPGSFEVLPSEETGWGKDSSYVFRGTTLLPGFDPNTVAVVGNGLCIRDGSRVRCAQGESDADGSTLRALGGRYLADATHVYVDERAIDGADVASFEPLAAYSGDRQMEYGRDKHRIYYMGRRMDTDPTSFEAVGDGTYAFGKDRAKVFENQSVVAEADPKSWRLLKGYWSTDAKSVFYIGVRYPTRGQVERFEPLNGTYQRDDEAVYYLSLKDGDRRPIEFGAATDTFQVIANQFARDALTVFYWGKPIEADPDSFIPWLRALSLEQGPSLPRHSGPIGEDRNGPVYADLELVR